jgi:hypothetical protein
MSHRCRSRAVQNGHAEHRGQGAAGAPDRRISHVGPIPSVTTRDRDSRHRAVRDAATAQVAVTAGQDSVKAAKVTAVLIKRCRTVLMERCRCITKCNWSGPLVDCLCSARQGRTQMRTPLLGERAW